MSFDEILDLTADVFIFYNIPVYACMHRIPFAGRYGFRWLLRDSKRLEGFSFFSAAQNRHRILPGVTPRPNNASEGKPCTYIPYYSRPYRTIP